MRTIDSEIGCREMTGTGLGPKLGQTFKAPNEVDPFSFTAFTFTAFTVAFRKRILIRDFTVMHLLL
eukprot:COSAG02_NODE_746_length_17729_cov_37.532501_4_plen_66_part_00